MVPPSHNLPDQSQTGSIRTVIESHVLRLPNPPIQAGCQFSCGVQHMCTDDHAVEFLKADELLAPKEMQITKKCQIRKK